MRVHLTILGGSLLDLTIGEDQPDDEPKTFGFHGGSTCQIEIGETMLDYSDRAKATTDA
jgi:hypothetical protein